MSGVPRAFWSYARTDETASKGLLRRFCAELQLQVRAASGREDFSIFLDSEHLELGSRWQEALDGAVNGATFFFPILSPAFFRSPHCRHEFGEFIGCERELGRDDLILPIYWRTTPVIEDAELRNQDPVAREISRRQRWDWRDHRNRPPDTLDMLPVVDELAEEIARVMHRVLGPTPVRGG